MPNLKSGIDDQGNVDAGDPTPASWCPWGVGFGDYVREQVARTGGDPNSRQALQDFGQGLVETDPDSFCRAVLRSADFTAGGSLVVDGIRHADIYHRLQQLAAPSRAILLHLIVEDNEAQRRVQNRGDRGANLPHAQMHRVEAETTSSLPNIADRVIDATSAPHTICVDILPLLLAAGADATTIARARNALRASTSK